MILYRFALLAGSSTVVDIESVSPVGRREYECPGCGCPLVARLGERNAHHFAHKSGTATCSFETFLHTVAKYRLFNNIRDRISEKRKLFLEYQQSVRCRSCAPTGLQRDCELRPRWRRNDVLARYTTVGLETTRRGVRPDILLQSDDDQLLVEIAVTHPCDAQKIAIGDKIVELTVTTEEDISLLDGDLLNPSKLAPVFHNFHITPHVERLSTIGNCRVTEPAFCVYSSGKANYASLSVAKWRVVSKRTIYRKPYPDGTAYSGRHYVFDIIEAFRSGVRIKSCHLCRYHGPARRNGYSLHQKVFCKLQRNEVKATTAASCEAYRVDEACFTSVH
jgi:hypothetical protein